MIRLLCCLSLATAALAQKTSKEERFFDQKVAPVLTRRCLGCHNEQLKNAGISFTDRASLVKGGSHGPAVVPGKPDISYLIVTLRHDGDVRMPPGPKLPAAETAILRKWIERGAVWGSKLRSGHD